MISIPSNLPGIKTIQNNTAKKKNTNKSTSSSSFESELRSGSSSTGNSGVTAPVEKVSIQEPIHFTDLLEQIAPANQDKTRDINLLWKDLPDLEKRLIHERSEEALQEYKERVRLLLNAILANNTKITQQKTAIPGSTQKKVYTHVAFLDEKLKILSEIITDPQNSAFRILKQMDNIKGFLLDVEQ